MGLGRGDEYYRCQSLSLHFQGHAILLADIHLAAHRDISQSESLWERTNEVVGLHAAYLKLEQRALLLKGPLS